MAATTKPLVVITGASSGIGEACAKVFAGLGHPLLLLARRVERMEALKLGDSVLCRKVDVCDREALNAAVKEAEAKFGPTDLMINNAGVMQLASITEQKPEEWYAMIDVNMKGVLHGMQAVCGQMAAREGGTIVNVSSVAGRKNFPNHVAYCGTKFGVHAMSEGLREELAAKNVRVIRIAPGAVETELLSHTTVDSIKAGYDAWKTQMGGVMTSEDIAESIRWAYSMPQRLTIREIVLTATKQGP